MPYYPTNSCSLGEGGTLTVYKGFSLVFRTYIFVSGFFFIISLSGVRLSPLGTSATIWPIAQAPDDR
jgi:hypothetical protein